VDALIAYAVYCIYTADEDLHHLKVKSNETSFFMLPVFIKDIALVGRAQNFTPLFSSGVALNMCV
jgi:hypothetical protein